MIHLKRHGCVCGGDPPPHSRCVVGPLCQEEGFGGIPHHSRGIVGPLHPEKISEGNGLCWGFTSSPLYLIIDFIDFMRGWFWINKVLRRNLYFFVFQKYLLISQRTTFLYKYQHFWLKMRMFGYRQNIFDQIWECLTIYQIKYNNALNALR